VLLTNILRKYIDLTL